MVMLVTFHSVSSALMLEALGKERGIACSVIPVPRKLSSSCGYAAELEMDLAEELHTLLDENGLEWEAVYAPQNGEYQTLFNNRMLS